MRELGRVYRMRRSYCTSILDARGRWGSVGLVLSEEGRLWMSNAQHIRVFHAELLQLQPKCAAATRQPTQKKTRKRMWVVVLKSAKCSEKSP